MDQRSQNRWREHESHGWEVVEGKTSSLQPGKELRICPRDGWCGWVDPKEEVNE